MDQEQLSYGGDERELRLDADRAWQPFRDFQVVLPETRSLASSRHGRFQRLPGMSDDERLPKGKRPNPLEASFDRYLNKQLRQIFDPVLDEDIPDAIASLLEGFDTKTEPSSSPATGKDKSQKQR